MSGKGQEKQAARAKPKKSAKEQFAQTQPNPTSRDTTPKPGAAMRKPSEAQVKPTTPPQTAHPEETHVPMNNFNAAEVEAMLSAGASDETTAYKPEKPTLKAGGAWGAKPGVMANGKDFWLELRRQVADIQVNGGVRKSEKNQGG